MLCNGVFTKIKRDLKDLFKGGNKHKVSEMSNLPFQKFSPNTNTQIDIKESNTDIRIYTFKRRKNMYLSDSEI